MLAADLSILNIRDVKWLLVGDTATYYLSWEFFRKTPVLQWPLGRNPNFGAGFDSSVVYSDSLPLVALVLKPFSKLISGDLQFLGWWLFLCFILQAYFALKLLTLLNVSRLVYVVSLPFFVLNPAFIDRTTFRGYGHLSLTAHWLLLAAMYLFSARATRHRSWLVLAVGAVGINFYCFVMVFGFTLVWSATQVLKSKPRIHKIWNEIAFLFGTLVCCVGLLFLLGGFVGSTFSDSGLGQNRTTLFSLVDSSTPSGNTWSVALPPLDISTPAGADEGFGYLGSGLFVLTPIAVLAVLRRFSMRNIKQALPMGLVAAVFFALSLSHRVALSSRELFSVELPIHLANILGVVRATGRFIWVPMYVLILAILALVFDLFRLKPFRLAVVLILASSFQLVDSYAALAKTRNRFTSPTPKLIFENRDWDEIANGRNHLVSIPPLNNDPRWIDLAVFAHRNSMSTNAAYLARIDEDGFEQLVETTQRALERREFDIDTMYIITNYPPNSETPKLFDEVQRGNLQNLRIIQVKELTIVYRISSNQ